MHIRWFGTPWNEFLCKEDRKIDTPTGTKCLECEKKIGERDRGVVCCWSPRIWGHWQLVADGNLVSVCSYHLACFLAAVPGGMTEGTRIEERSRGATAVPITDETEESFPIPDQALEEIEERHQPGRGWRK